MNNKAILATLVVAIVVIAGVAVVLTGNHGSSHEKAGDSTDMSGRLTIFGNANNDDYIDYRDVETVKAIIAGEQDAVYFDCYKDYKGTAVKRTLADANADGKIDEADVVLIQDMVDRKQNMQIYFYDVDSVLSSCTYPLENLCVGYKSNYEAVLICGAQDKVVGACNQVIGENAGYAKWYASYFPNATGFGSRFNPDYEEIQNINEKKGVSAMISGTRAWFDPNMEETLAPIGVDVVRLPFYEDGITVSAVITLGYLLGNEDKAYEYADLADGILTEIAEKTSAPGFSKKTVFSTYKGTSISRGHEGIQETVRAAGGLYITDTTGVSNGSIDAEGILSLDSSIDYIVFDIYYGFLETFESNSATKDYVYNTLLKTDKAYMDNVDMTGAYKRGDLCVIGQGVYMGPASYIGVAFLANQLYPDVFHFDVDKLFDQYMDTYHPGYSSSDFAGLEYFTLDEWKAYASA